MSDIFVYRDKWDDTINYYRPCGESPQWNTDKSHRKFLYTLGEYMHSVIGDFSSFLYREIPQFTYIDKSEIESVNKYLYVVNIYEPMYFFLQDKFGLDFLDKEVLNDIRLGKCQLIFSQDVEGCSGIQTEVYRDDFKIIQRWIEEYSLPSNNVWYINANFKSVELAKAHGCTANIIPITVQEAWNDVNKYPDPPVDFEPIDDKYLFLNYCRRPRTHRVYVGSALIRENLFDKGKNSFNALEPLVGNLSIALQLIDKEILPYAQELFSKSPLLIDRDNSGDDITLYIPEQDYSTTFIHIVGETQYSLDTLFISEKTWKPIIMGVPFVVISSAGALKWLQNEGFKTFSKWFDESYDEEQDPYIRFNKIVGIIKYFSTKSIEELKEIRQDMYEVCLFNKNLLIERTNKKFFTEEGHYIHHKPTVDRIIEIYNK